MSSAPCSEETTLTGTPSPTAWPPEPPGQVALPSPPDAAPPGTPWPDPLLPPPPGGGRLPPAWPEPQPGPPHQRRTLITVITLTVLVVLVAGAVLPALTRWVRAPAHGEFHFLMTDATGRPYRWNPCDSIHYVVNLGTAPEGSLNDVQEAVRRVSAATGISFSYDGFTDEIPTEQRSPYQPDRYGNRWAPVVIAWVSQSQTDVPFVKNGGTAAGIASPETPSGGGGTVFVSGWVIINSNDPNDPGFANYTEQGPVVEHELGHIVGLGHVKQMGELMEFSGGGMTDYGPGDLEGLKELGIGEGCLTTPPVPSG